MCTINDVELQTAADSFEFRYINKDVLNRIIDNVRQSQSNKNKDAIGCELLSKQLPSTSNDKCAEVSLVPALEAPFADELNIIINQSDDENLNRPNSSSRLKYLSNNTKIGTTRRLATKRHPQMLHRSLSASRCISASAQQQQRYSARPNQHNSQDASNKYQTTNHMDGRPSSSRMNSTYSEQITLTKITTYQQNIQEIIAEIFKRLQKDRWHDGVLDLSRRGKCFAAFLLLFNRNFLYRIQRMIVDIRGACGHQIDIGMKICTLYSVICQGAALYLRHIDNFILDGLPEKLIVFLTAIKEATIVCLERNFFDCQDAIVQALIGEVDNILHQLHRVATKKCKLRKLEDGVENVKQKINSIRTAMYAQPNIDKLTMYRPRKTKKRPSTVSHKHTNINYVENGDEDIIAIERLNLNEVSNCDEQDTADALLTMRRDFYECAIEKFELIKAYHQNKLNENQTESKLS